jgi:transmembrane sensor
MNDDLDIDTDRMEREPPQPMAAYEPSREQYRKAAEWLLRLREKGLETSRGFERWKSKDPAHAFAYAELEGLFSESLQPARDAPYFFEGRRPPRRFAGGWIAGMAIAASLLLALMPLNLDAIRYFNADAVTAPGETRRVTLADGSVVTLNSGSAIETDMTSPTQRTIKLLGGEAFFEIAKNKSRPAMILAGDAHVRVVGTKFNIRIDDYKTKVSVTEGLVRIAPNGHPDQFSLLPAGQEAIVSSDLVRTQPVDLLNIESWRHHRLILSYMPLRSAVREFNRYRRAPIIIANGALAAKVVSGVFATDDPDDILRILEQNLGVESFTLPTGQTFLY